MSQVEIDGEMEWLEAIGQLCPYCDRLNTPEAEWCVGCGERIRGSIRILQRYERDGGATKTITGDES